MKNVPICVATHIIRTDGQVSNLQTLDTVDIESFIQDSMLDNRISFLGSHRTGSETVPSSLDMAFCPFNDMIDVFIGVNKIFADLLLVAVEEGGRRCCSAFQRHTPTSMLDARSDVVFSRISFGRCQIHIHSACGTVVGVEWMHGSYFAGVGVHASSGLAGLDVTPDHGCHVAFVVHEASVEVGGVVGRGRGYVREASAEGVLEEVEHGEKLSGRHQHVVSEPSGDDTVMHHRFLISASQHCRESIKV